MQSEIRCTERIPRLKCPPVGAPESRLYFPDELNGPLNCRVTRKDQ